MANALKSTTWINTYLDNILQRDVEPGLARLEPFAHHSHLIFTLCLEKSLFWLSSIDP